MTAVLHLLGLPLRGQATRVFEGADHGAEVSFLVVDAPPGEGAAPHTHPYAEVFVVQEGEARFSIGDRTLQVSGPRVVVAPAHTPHAFVATGTGRLRSVNIHPVPRIVTEWLAQGAAPGQVAGEGSRSAPGEAPHSAPGGQVPGRGTSSAADGGTS
jgi:quercetin dioxygenase-like cupin family protein